MLRIHDHFANVVFVELSFLRSHIGFAFSPARHLWRCRHFRCWDDVPNWIVCQINQLRLDDVVVAVAWCSVAHSHVLCRRCGYSLFLYVLLLIITVIDTSTCSCSLLVSFCPWHIVTAAQQCLPLALLRVPLYVAITLSHSWRCTTRPRQTVVSS
jgi:hypothetical protein